MDRETVDEIKHHFGVVIEGVKSDVRAVAEGLSALEHKVDAGFANVAREFDETRALIRLERVEARLAS